MTLPALQPCQEQARALHHAIAEASWDALPAEAGPLAEGEHPFAHLLTLIEDRDELGDERGACLHASVVAAFGAPLAAAAAQAMLATPGEHAGMPGVISD